MNHRDAAESAVRVAFLRSRGYKIGKTVYIGRNVRIESSDVTIGNDVFILDNVVIKSPKVVIGSNTCIFRNVYIHALESFRTGMRGKISRNCSFKANRIRIDRDFWCNENAEIGGGGWKMPEANIDIGPFMHVGKDVHLNVCKPILLEGFSGIGMGCMLFTHGAGQGQSVMDGYTAVEAPIRVGKHVSLFTRVICDPGCVIEDGVLVGTGAYARGHLEKNGFYAGIPAKKKRVVVEDPPKKEDILKEYFGFEAGGEGVLTKKSGEAVLWFDREQECIEIFTENKKTWTSRIDLKQNTIFGKATVESEAFRDSMRRKGVILKPVGGYEFSKLNAFSLIEAGIELW